MEQPEKIEEGNVPLNGLSFLSPLLLAGVHSIIIEAAYQSSSSYFSLLLTTFKVFWPLFIVGAAIVVKSLPPSNLQIAARYVLCGSVMAGLGFYAEASAITSTVSCSIR